MNRNMSVDFPLLLFASSSILCLPFARGDFRASIIPKLFPEFSSV